jgi:hypothetical protein
MATVTGSALSGTDGFCVEVDDEEVGVVEELWIADDGMPQALALRTAAGRHCLLLAEDVALVDREQRRVVVRHGTRVLELEPPHLVHTDGRIEATWATTGAAFELPPPAPPQALAERVPHPEPNPTQRTELRAVAFTIAALYGSLAALTAALIGACFLVAWLVTGQAY